MNPLLDFTGLPRFTDIRSEHVASAVDAQLSDNRALIQKLLSDTTQPTWQNFVTPLDDAGEKLHRLWGAVSHLNAVMNSAELRDAYNSNLPKVTEYSAEVGQNEKLFARFKSLAASDAFHSLSKPQKKIIENDLRDFRLGGADLPVEQKPRFAELQEKLADLGAKFQDNVLDATNDFSLLIENKNELDGVPDDVLQGMAEEAQKENKTGYKITLHYPSYMPVMQYAHNRTLREKLYIAYVTRASEFGKAEWDNTKVIADILALRRELAAMLGYHNFAEYSLATKMAKRPTQVIDFIEEIAIKAKPYADQDVKDLQAFAREQLKIDKLESWDMAYASEKLREQRYAFSEQEVKQYFPETVVLPGMFKVVETIYAVTIREAKAPVWNSDVKFFEILNLDDKPIGQFYLDMYARSTKRGGAWMDDAITRRKKSGGIQIPVAYLNCNFSAPIGGKPAVFTHDEVITLFHEFGHGLHHLLTQIDEIGVSGINGVEWDAVELPSQFMENFCWEWDVLKHMTKHVDSGMALPKELFDKMIAAKNFQSGMQTMRQLEFSLFDMRLHYDYQPEKETLLELLDEVRSHVAVVFPPNFNRFANQFSHIFGGGYAAGYYSYKWAEVLSADAYAAFEENGVLDEKTGDKFRREILSMGGSRPAMESFKAFRGREPSIDALLRHNGMAA
ncbi:MAG: oligopeptidase [Pseudomonadota bacterium]|jgi:oligopeptidase A